MPPQQGSRTPTREELLQLPLFTPPKVDLDAAAGVNVPPPSGATSVGDQLRGIQGTSFGRGVSDVATGLGVTPSQIGQNISGLLQMFRQSPLTTADQALGLVTDPIKRTMTDPKVRQGLIYLGQNFGPTTLGSAMTSEIGIPGMTGVPGVGNQYVEPRERIEAGDVMGGRRQAMGAAAQIPAAVFGPEAANAVTTAATNIPRYGVRGGGGTNRMGRLALDFGPDVPIETARAGTDAVLDNGLLRFGINYGQDKAKVMAERANQGAMAASGPGAMSFNANVLNPQVFGPNPRNTTLGPMGTRNVDELLASPRTQPEQLGYMQDQLGRMQADVPRRGATAGERIPFAENARFGQRDLGESATIDMRRAFAGDERDAIRQAAPATTPFLGQLEALDEGQRALSLARPKPYTGTATQFFGGARFPAIQTIDDLLVRAPRAGVNRMGELVRAAILAQMVGPENPER